MWVNVVGIYSKEESVPVKEILLVVYKMVGTRNCSNACFGGLLVV